MNENKAVFDYDSRKLSHFKIDSQIEEIEEKKILTPLSVELETHMIDNESFKKYHVRIPRFWPEFVLDLRQKRSLTGAQLLHHIETADPFTKIWLPGKEIKIKYNLEITKPLFL